MNSPYTPEPIERRKKTYLRKILKLESDLRAARAELEAARGRVTELEAELKQPISDTALRKRNDGYLPVGNGCMLVTPKEWDELTALRRQIDGAETINLRDGEMGKITTYKLLEVKP